MLRASRLFLIALVFAALSMAIANAQETAPSLGQLLLAANSSFGSVPSDVVVQAQIHIQAGGRTEDALFKVATRGIIQSYEQIDGPFTKSRIVFSRGDAKREETLMPLEYAATAQTPIIPGPLIAALINDSETVGRVVGHEDVNGISTYHVLVWKSFASSQDKYLLPFTQKEIWIDPVSGAVRKIAFERREAGGATPGIRHEFVYDDFRQVHGINVPFRIDWAVNGTPWASVTVTSVAVNVGLTDQDFSVQ